MRDVEAILPRIEREDRKLGGRRPEVMQALNASLTAHLDNARRLRLLRDQWLLRRAAYREYERSVSSSILQLVKAQPALEAIKRLDGPSPSQLTNVRARLGSYRSSSAACCFVVPPGEAELSYTLSALEP